MRRGVLLSTVKYLQTNREVSLRKTNISFSDQIQWSRSRVRHSTQKLSRAPVRLRMSAGRRAELADTYQITHQKLANSRPPPTAVVSASRSNKCTICRLRLCGCLPIQMSGLWVEETLRFEALKPLGRLLEEVDVSVTRIVQYGCENKCMISIMRIITTVKSFLTFERVPNRNTRVDTFPNAVALLRGARHRPSGPM